MRQNILDPARVSRRSRLDPLRCYLSLRRTFESYWYRSFWRSDPWIRFASSESPPIDIDCSKDEVDMLAALDMISSAVNANDIRVLYYLARYSSAVGDIVEIGSDQGKSTIALSWGASRSAQPCLVHAVDPFPDGEALTSLQRVRLFEKHL